MAEEERGNRASCSLTLASLAPVVAPGAGETEVILLVNQTQTPGILMGASVGLLLAGAPGPPL